jgi:4-amino-4-deoxychorismate lyase
MYSSIFNGIITDPCLMVVPIDDHQVTRGHAVFDTANVINGRCYGLDKHIERLIDSATKAKIDYSSKYNIEIIRNIVLSTIAASGKSDNIFVRMWLSVGRGDFAITPYKCDGGTSNPSLYVVVHEDTTPHHKQANFDGHRETIVDQPMKSPFLSTLKSNNYLINAVAAMEAQEKGGKFGIQLDDSGYLAELSIASLAIVTEDGWLLTPHLDRLLRSTTLIRSFDLLPKLVEKKLLKGFQFADILPEDAMNSSEAFGFGGHGMQLITHLNDKVIGRNDRNESVPGPVFCELARLLANDLYENEDMLDSIPYEKYNYNSYHFSKEMFFE